MTNPRTLEDVETLLQKAPSSRDRLLEAAKSVVETKKYFNPSDQWHHGWRLALDALAAAVRDAEAKR